MHSSDETNAALLGISRHQDGHHTVLTLDGELDLAGSDWLAVEARRALEPPTEVLGMDTRDLTFIDSAGLVVLLNVREEALRRGIQFDLRSVTAPVRRMIDLAGLGDLLLGSAGPGS